MTQTDRTHEGFLLIEALIALVIVLIALAMVYMAPSWMYKTAAYAEFEAALFDVGFSYAEEKLTIKKGDLGLVSNASNTTIPFTDSSGNTIQFKCAFVTASKEIAGATVDFATFTISPISQTTRIATLTFTAILKPNLP